MFGDKNIQNSILRKIKCFEFSSKKDKINYGINILNALLSEIDSKENKEENLSDFIADVILAIRESCSDKKAGSKSGIEKYVENTDKFILRACYRQYSSKLMELVKNTEDLENRAAICIINYKHCKIVDNDIHEIYKKATGAIKEALVKNFKEILFKNDEDSNFCKNKLVDNIAIKHKIYVSKIYKTEKNIQFKFSEVWNDFEIFKKNFKIIRDRVIYETVKNDPNGVNHLIEINKILNLFNSGIRFLQRNKLKNSQTCFLEILNSGKISEIMHSLLALIHFFKLEYQESKYHIRIGSLILHQNSSHFTNALGFIDRFGEITGVNSNLKMRFLGLILNSDQILALKKGWYSLQNNDSTQSNLIVTNNSNDNSVLCIKESLDIEKHFENKLYCSIFMNTDELYSQVKFFTKFLNKVKFDSLICQTKLKYLEYSIISIYVSKNKLMTNNLKNTHVFIDDWEKFKSKFDQIMNENMIVLKTLKGVPEKWWKSRKDLDQRLEEFFKILKNEFTKIFPILKERIILILDDECNSIPFEVIFDRKIVSRILSLEYLFNTFPDVRNEIDYRHNSFYLLDPGNNLNRTKRRISEFIQKRNVLNGVSGRSLIPEERKSLAKYELFMYFGHGTGKKHFSMETAPQRLFLFGCSSVKLLYTKNYRLNGMISNDRIILGNLWDVTDKDLDILTEKFLEENISFPKGFGRNMETYRSYCNLKYLNGAALVIYGII